ncbi:hemicentin-2-like [Epinephelus moara]|uniref:hemicentin-2-like n=1 Tax=Epinephelus moara TaxID=300413 RepID=UPI00214E17E8|nr:hemicentin-2-like [Epinephelus moara]
MCFMFSEVTQIRGAAMSLTAAASGFVVFLLSVPVIQGQDGWGVTYTSTEICAVKGSTVEIHCSYRYPSRKEDKTDMVKTKFWFTKVSNKEPVDLTTDRDYTGRVQYLFRDDYCTLRITDLRESDAAVYKFRFTTHHPSGYTGSPGVTLSVTDLQVLVEGSSTQAELKCQGRCNVAGHTPYVWYNNGEKLEEETSSHSVSVNDDGSYSCAVKGHEDHRSPPVYSPKLPSVSVSPSAEILEGSSVTLTCSSDANPAAKYTWHKENGNPRPLSEGPQLVFSSIQSSDSGRYYCTAENRLGTTKSRSISINVEYAPKLSPMSVSPSGEIRENREVTLTCSSDANPAATYTWYKENGNLRPLSEEPQLVFSSIQSSDSGQYYCTAENKLGRRTSNYIPINVKYAPKLSPVSVSPSAEIVEGSSVTLTCSSDANPAATYTWCKNGNLRRLSEEPQLVFSSIQSSDSGRYYCTAQNELGTSTPRSISINVKYAPKLSPVSVSPSAEIVEGSSVTLTCSSDAKPAAKYTWYKKNRNPGLSPSKQTWNIQSSRNQLKLVLRSIRSSDSGQYFCVAENELGKASSQSIFINVKYAPKLPSVSARPSRDVKESSSVTLTCSSDANPAANYTWYKKNGNGKPLSEEPQLVFSSIQSSDSGRYYCTAENRLGRRTSYITINVKYAPKLPSVSVSPSAEIVEGSSVTLTCSSDANPAANYTWYKNGNPGLPPSKQTQMVQSSRNQSKLIFSSVQPSDSGEYYCAAENKVGRTTSKLIFIDVKYAPKLPSVSVSPSAEIVEGSSVTLTCSSDANPAAKYTWYKEKQILLRGPEGGLHFTSISSEESGIYYCKSDNPYGQIISSSIFIDVQYAPKLPSVSVSPSAEIVEGSSVNLTCSSDANPAANYTWYKENEDSPKASGQIFTITDFTAEHSGNYYCEAQNSRGRHRFTIHLTVVAGNSLMIMNIIRLTLVVLMLIPLLLLSLWMRKNQTLSTTTEPHEPVEIELESCPVYGNVSDAAAKTEDRGAGRPGVKSSQMQLNQRRDSPDGNKVVRHGNISVEISFKASHFTPCTVLIFIHWGSFSVTHSGFITLSAPSTVCFKGEMNTASFGVLFIFTALSISKGNEAFIRLQCVAENVGVIGQQSLLECVVKSTQGIADVTIILVTWRKVGDERPLLVFHREQTELQPGYMFAEPSWNGGNMNVSLLITNTAVEHEGVYTCMVMTDSGYATSQTSLKVTGALSVPSVSVSPSAEIVEGSSVTLTCSSDANPAANYTWYKKNGNPNLHPLSKEPQLVFSSIQSSDSGEYYCTAENELGRRTSESIAIDVQLNPSAEIVEGSSVTLTCSSDANPAAKYTWYKENEDSPKASGQIFTISNVTAEHSGNYYCEAQNTRGRHNSTLHLTVVADHSVMNIIRLTLVVLVLTLLLLLSLWTRKKKTLSFTTEPHGPVEVEKPGRSSQLQLQQGSRVSSSTHRQRRGAAMSFKAAAAGLVFLLSVSVIQGQDGWEMTYRSTEICAVKGSTVEIPCSYSYPSKLKVHNATVKETLWFTRMNGNEPLDLKTDSEYAGRVQYHCEETNCTLTVTDLRESDSAVYKFMLITDQTDGRFAALPGVTLSVTALQVQVTRITVGQSVTEAELKCYSSCSPAGRLSYVWFKSGVRLTKVQTASYKDSFHLGDNISCALQGYEQLPSPSVYALNPPSVSVSPSAEIVEGSSVNLTCRSDANPAAKYTWYKENVNLKPPSEEPQLVFSSIQSSDSGWYYCTAENELGRSNDIIINVKYAPKLPSVSVSPSAEIVEGSSVTLTCSSDANPAANYTWYKENEDSPKASGQIFTITNITAEHSGNYYCEAKNTRGRHNSTFNLIAVADKSTNTKTIITLTLVFVMLILLLLALLCCVRFTKKKL